MADVNLWTYLAALRARIGLIAAITVLAMVLAFGISLVLPKSYRAQTRLLFPAPSPSGMAALAGGPMALSGTVVTIPFLGGLVTLPNYTNVPALCTGILRSRTVGEQVVRDNDLMQVFRRRRMSEAMKMLTQATKIETDREGVLSITVEVKGKHLAPAIANDYVRKLKATAERLTVGHARRNRVFIRQQLDRAGRRLETAEQNLRRFQQQHGIVALPEEVSGLLTTQAGLQGERARAQVALAATSSQLAAVTRQIRAEAAALDSLPSHSRLIKDWGKELISLNTDLALALQVNTESHPTVLNLRARIDEIKRQLRRDLTKELSALQVGIAPEVADIEVERISGEAKLAALSNVLGSLQAKLDALPPLQMQMVRLQRQVNLETARYKMLAEEYERAQLAEAREGVDFEVLDPAVVPDRPSHPRPLLNTALAGFFGFWGALALVVLGHYREGKRG